MYLLFYSLIIAFPQINFHLTDPFNCDQSDAVTLEYSCLRKPVPKITKRQYSIQTFLSIQDFQEIISICLIWTQIADGHVDCLNDQIDEKFNWQLLRNECEEDEYRCANGQCISNQLHYNSKICEYRDIFNYLYLNLPVLYLENTSDTSFSSIPIYMGYLGQNNSDAHENIHKPQYIISKR